MCHPNRESATVLSDSCNGKFHKRKGLSLVYIFYV